jgi:hypothetical protein
MANKELTPTDIEKYAIVIDKHLKEILTIAGYEPEPRGDNKPKEWVPAYFRNTRSVIEMSYYDAMRNPERTPETRCWSNAFNGIAKPGLTFYVELRANRLEVEIS